MSSDPGIAGLSAQQGGMCLGLYGKHPARGDFIDSGIAPELLRRIELWLDATLPMVRSGLGAGWEPVWDQRGAARPVIAFWLGEAIWGSVVAGVLAPSRDKVGRRFPLLFVASGPAEAALPAPVIDQRQEWYATLARALHQSLEEAAFAAPSDLLAGLALPASDPAIAAAPPDFWAMRQGADVATLLADIVQTDHRRALTGRGYWWRAGKPSGPADLPVPDAAADQSAPVADLADPDEDPAGEDGSAPRAGADPAAPVGLDSATPVADSGGEAAQTPHQTPPVPVEEQPRYSQVYAGNGLPSADVLAWLLRGAS